MVKPDSQSRIIYFTNSPQLEESINAAFATEAEMVVMDGVKVAADPITAIHQAKPDIVLIDLKFREEDIFNIIDRIVTLNLTCPVIVLLPEERIHQSNLVILAGARAFLPYPFLPADLVNTTRRVRELQVRATTARPSEEDTRPVHANKQTIVVFSLKGGAGVTTTAINLAIALKQQVEDDVLLLDGKYILGHVAMLLNLRVGNSITDLIPHSDKLDPLLIKQVVVSHPSGISVLPSSYAVAKAQGIKPDDLYRVIQALQRTYPYIVVDGGNHLNDNTVTYMDTADKILLVVNPNLASLRDARQFLDICKTLSYPADKVALVLNQTGRKTDIKANEIEQVLQTKVIAAIPADEDAVLRSINEGEPVLLRHAGHAISKSIVKLAKEMIAASLTAESGNQAKGVPSNFIEMLKKSSRLG